MFKTEPKGICGKHTDPWLLQAMPESEPKMEDFFATYEYAQDFQVLVSVYRRRADASPELVHKEKLLIAMPANIVDGIDVLNKAKQLQHD